MLVWQWLRGEQQQLLLVVLVVVLLLVVIEKLKRGCRNDE